MASTEFFRLYRDLCRGETRKDEIDTLYEKQRKKVLHSLNYDVGQIEELVPIPKHHGKRARRKELEKSKSISNKSNYQSIEKIKKQNQLLMDLNILNEAVNETTALLIANKPIPPRLGRTIQKESTHLFTSQTKLPPITSVIIKNQISPFVGPGFDEEMRISNKESSNKWSQTEITRFTQLYHELEKPTCNHEDSWRIYYLRMAKRFIATFPNRSESEVIKKFHDLLKKRQIKEPGEKQYWDKKTPIV